MKILIVTFSGTGNTAFVGSQLANRLRAAGHRIDSVPVEVASVSLTDQDILAADLLVIGFPVYACDAPSPIHEFVARLVRIRPASTRPPATRPTSPIVLFCTRAFVAGNALGRVAQAFAGRERHPPFRVAGGVVIEMPGSDALLSSRPGGRYHSAALSRRYDNLPGVGELVTMIEGIAAAGPAASPATGDDLAAAALPLSPGGVIVGWLLRPLYVLLEKRLTSRFSADRRCIGCRKCEAVCPVDNITVNSNTPDKVKAGEPRHTVAFDDRCILCLRCVTQCPTEAIQIGKWSAGKVRWRGPDGSFDPQSLMEENR